MSESVTTSLSGGGKQYSTRYTRAEIIAAWYSYNNIFAREAHTAAKTVITRYSVAAPCTLDQALTISALFIRMFAIPECCHFDGIRVRLFCGHTHDVAELMTQAAKMMAVVLTEGVTPELLGDEPKLFAGDPDPKHPYVGPFVFTCADGPCEGRTLTIPEVLLNWSGNAWTERAVIEGSRVWEQEQATVRETRMHHVYRLDYAQRLAFYEGQE